MDTTRVFQRLVTDQFLGSDNLFKVFSFQTVFYRTRYSYRCCSCAFDHEYLTYISNSGKINDEIYEKIVYSIENGKCPHAEQVPEEFHVQTGIYGIHIALAVGNVLAAKRHIGLYSQLAGLLFNLRPYDIAVFKRKTSIACLIFDYLSRPNQLSNISAQTIACIRQLGVDPNRMTIEKVSRFEAYVDIGDADILKSILIYPVYAPCLVKALKCILKYCVPECLECVLQFIGQLATTDEVLSSYIIPCAEAAIIYNKHIVLEQILKPHISPSLTIICQWNPPLRPFPELGNISRQEIVSEMRTRLNSVCIVFDRPECRDVLSKYGIFQNINVSSNELITRRLFYFPCDYFEDEFATVLRHNSHTELNNIQKDLNACLLSPFTSLTLFRALLSAGANVNFLDYFKRTPLLTILMDYKHDHIDLMYKLKLLINENPDHETHKTAVQRGILRDLTSLHTYDKTVVRPGNYIVDAKQHGCYGYDDDDNFCLNFMGPFLMECGFPVSRQSLLDSLNRDLHPSVRAYILKYIESPMPLKVICRDTLRRHFKGRLIHRFVEQSQLPRDIKSFILLKSLLSTKSFTYTLLTHMKMSVDFV